MARRPGGGAGERGEGAAPLFPSPPSWGAARGPRPCPPFSPAHPPGYTRVAERWWAPGVGGGAPVGQCGGGGETFPRYDLLPCLPQAGIKAGRLVCAFLGPSVLLRPTAPAQGRRPSAGYAGVSGRPTGGAWRVAGFAPAVASLPCVQLPLQGGAGPQSLWPASGRPRAGGGRREGGGGGREGGSPLSPPGPLAPPADGRGAAAWWFRSRGASH